MDLFGKSPRPTLKSIDLDPVYTEIAEKLLKWINDSTCTLNEVKDDVKTVISHPNQLQEDGYSLAKDFENRCMYDADSQLVDILDNVWFIAHSYLSDKIKEWVTSDKIEPRFKIGDIMKIKYRGKEHEVEIAKISIEQAQYKVYIPTDGIPKSGTALRVLTYEDIEQNIINTIETL